MARRSRNKNFEQTLDLLRANSFDVTPYAGVAGGVLVTKHGAGAILMPSPESASSESVSSESASSRSAGSRSAGSDAPVAFWERPGAVYRGQVARLLDRGYQKFLKTPQFELPASAAQLQAIHLFSEELSQLIGTICLYNEALGTTSDLYEYDRLKGRETPEPPPVQPWQLAEGH